MGYAGGADGTGLGGPWVGGGRRMRGERDLDGLDMAASLAVQHARETKFNRHAPAASDPGLAIPPAPALAHMAVLLSPPFPRF